MFLQLWNPHPPFHYFFESFFTPILSSLFWNSYYSNIGISGSILHVLWLLTHTLKFVILSHSALGEFLGLIVCVTNVPLAVIILVFILSIEILKLIFRFYYLQLIFYGWNLHDLFEDGNCSYYNVFFIFSIGFFLLQFFYIMIDVFLSLMLVFLKCLKILGLLPIFKSKNSY